MFERRHRHPCILELERVEIDPQLPKPGAVIADKYRIERVIGVGGMGIVYAARHELLNNVVALKLLLPQVAKDKEAVARFLHEGRATARLQSAHVVRVMDVGMVGEAPFLAMELLAGEDLSQILETRGRFLITETVDHLLEAMEGLSHAHAAGIIHRDLKPSNLFLTHNEDDSRTIKVVDFGISKSMGKDSGNITSTAAVLGSPAYMAPEQLRSSKRVDARADIWSLGVIAFELLTGAIPFEGETVGEIFANVLERAPRRPGQLRVEIPGKLEEAILRCLQKSPDARFPNVGELAGAIARFGTGRCDGLIAGIEKKFGTPGVGLDPMRSPSIPDLDVTSAPPPKPKSSAPKLPPVPISATGNFDFDDEMSGPSLMTMDEVASPRSRPSLGPSPTSSASIRVPAVSARPRAAPSATSDAFREWLLPIALHGAIVVATLALLRRFAPTHGAWSVLAFVPGTTEGAASSSSAIVGGAFAVACVLTSIVAISSRSARWGFIVATLGMLVMSLGMFLIVGASSGGLVGVSSGEKTFVAIGAPVVALGVGIACLGKARDLWRDDERALPPLLAAVAGGIFFCALQLSVL